MSKSERRLRTPRKLPFWFSFSLLPTWGRIDTHWSSLKRICLNHALLEGRSEITNLKSSFLSSLYDTRHCQHGPHGTEQRADYVIYLGLGRHALSLCVWEEEGKAQPPHTATLLSGTTWMILIRQCYEPGILCSPLNSASQSLLQEGLQRDVLFWWNRAEGSHNSVSGGEWHSYIRCLCWSFLGSGEPRGNCLSSKHYLCFM